VIPRIPYRGRGGVRHDVPCVPDFACDASAVDDAIARAVRRAAVAVAAAAVLAWTPPAIAASDPLCLGSYGNATPRAGAPLRFGVDPGLAGSVGGAQLPS